MPTCGWEGRDLVDALEARGQAEGWRAAGLEARGSARDERTETLAREVQSLLSEAPAPLAAAVEGVDRQPRSVVVRFRPPVPLRPVETDGRVVECLLYQEGGRGA